MGLRFRKSFKVAPGIKVNLNKKSSSVTFGGKGVHYTVNSKGKRTKSVGIPGTGLYYTESSTTGKSKKSSSGNSKNSNIKESCNTKKNTNKQNTKNSKSFFQWILIFFLIGIIISLYPLCWIIAVPALFYFLKSEKYKDYKKRNTIICAIISITSFLFFIYNILNPTIQLNAIDVDWKSDTFYVGDTTEIIIEKDPLEAQIDELKLSDNDVAKLKYEDGKAIITFIKDGDASLYLIANDGIKSSTKKVTVIDKEKQEAERKAKEEAEQAAAQKAQEEQAAAQKAQEEAQQAAAEQAALQQSQAALQQSQAAQTEIPQEQMVWIPSTGNKYHTYASCSGMKNPTQISLSDAQNRGYEPCKRCH